MILLQCQSLRTSGLRNGFYCRIITKEQWEAALVPCYSHRLPERCRGRCCCTQNGSMVASRGPCPIFALLKRQVWEQTCQQEDQAVGVWVPANSGSCLGKPCGKHSTCGKLHPLLPGRSQRSHTQLRHWGAAPSPSSSHWLSVWTGVRRQLWGPLWGALAQCTIPGAPPACFGKQGMFTWISRPCYTQTVRQLFYWYLIFKLPGFCPQNPGTKVNEKTEAQGSYVIFSSSHI